MKVNRTIVLSLLLLATASYATASSAEGLTRAQVRADLVRVEKAGYNPSIGEDVNYPSDIQAAEAKIAAEDQQKTNDAIGGAPMGSSTAGAHVVPAKTR
jgi:hypothetical protein